MGRRLEWIRTHTILGELPEQAPLKSHRPMYGVDATDFTDTLTEAHAAGIIGDEQAVALDGIHQVKRQARLADPNE